MIGKGKSISHTRASMSYGWNQEKDAEIVLKEFLHGDSPAEITKEFKMLQDQNYHCKKNTFSFVISPTIEDGKRLDKNKLQAITKHFIHEMKLGERQAIAFVHQDKDHKHIHLYVNRIDFKGVAYNDSFIGKRSQLAAEKVAEHMGLTTVKQVQFEKEFNLKGSEVHRNMSLGNIGKQMSGINGASILKGNTVSVNLAGKMTDLIPSLALKITKFSIRKVIQKGIGY